MANLCVLVSGHVNGVSRLHGELLKRDLFSNFANLYPDKFCGITNGITQRRWLAVANPPLAALVDKTVGPGFMEDWTKIENLGSYIDDTTFCEEYRVVKQEAKKRFSKWANIQHGIDLNPECVFDVQAKRLHEYKRQLLKLLHIIALFDDIETGNIPKLAKPTTFIFAAKAAPAYHIAKETIALACSLSNAIEKSPTARDLIKVVFLPNYGVSTAEMLIPATDISEQISLAGTEASGTGNMKFMLNGAVTIGTLDGANVEMSELLGSDSIYIFGENVEGAQAVLSNYNPFKVVEGNPRLAMALNHLIDGRLLKEDGSCFDDLYHALVNCDRYLVLHDFSSYDEVYTQLHADMKDIESWTQKMIANTAAAGFFSSDRTVEEYNRLIWHLS
jgi:starch phosphorylase